MSKILKNGGTIKTDDFFIAKVKYSGKYNSVAEFEQSGKKSEDCK